MESTGAKRRALLAGGALTVAAGCGANPQPVIKQPESTGSATPQPAGTPSPPPQPAGTPSPPPMTSPKAADVPVGGGIILDLQDGIVVTQPKPGVFKAFTAVCTHEGCVVTSVDNGTILCPCHGSKFRIADGSVAVGPAKSPLKAIPIKVSDGLITFT